MHNIYIYMVYVYIYIYIYMHTFWAVSQVGRALRAMKNLLLVSYVELRTADDRVLPTIPDRAIRLLNHAEICRSKGYQL